MSARLVVDTAAVEHNVRVLRGPGRTPLMAVVKADGFGHGARRVATAALGAGAESLGVATLAEACELADLGAPVLTWLNAPDALAQAGVPGTIEYAVGSAEHLRAVLAAPRAEGALRPRRVHLFVDTGMSRDGSPVELWGQLCEAAATAQRAGAVRVAGVMGHLGCADDPADACLPAAVGRFNRAVRVAEATGMTPGRVHLAATSAALTLPIARRGLLRTGAGLVGIDPTGGSRLVPAGRLVAPLVQVRRARRGDTVGYGHDHRLARDAWLGLVPVGYADGLPRAASGAAQAFVDGRRCRIVGRVSMDQVVIDLGERPVEVGAEVTLFGPGGDGEPTLREWAGWADTIEHEVATGIGSRVRRANAPAPAVLAGAQGAVA